MGFNLFDRPHRLAVDHFQLRAERLGARGALLIDDLFARRQVRVELVLHRVRDRDGEGLNAWRRRRGRLIRIHLLRTDADDGLLRSLGLLGGDGRLAGRLAVLNLLRRGDQLFALFALLVDGLLACRQRVVEDDLSLEGDLAGLGGGQRLVSDGRAVLNERVHRILGLLIIRGHRCVAALGREVSGERLLTQHALGDNLDLTRLQFRVRFDHGVERHRRRPGHLLRSLIRLRADSDDLFSRLFQDLLGGGRLAVRLAVLNRLRDRDLLRARLAFLGNLLLARRQGRVVDDTGRERDLGLNRVHGLAGGLGAHADDLLSRLLGALRGDGRVTGGLAVDKLLRGSGDLIAELALLIDDLLALCEGVIEDDLGGERNRLVGLGHQLVSTETRAVLDDALDRFLGVLIFNNVSLVALSGELGGVGLLALLALLDNLGLTRGQVRVFTHLGRVRDRERPGHILGALGWLGADDDDLVGRGCGLLPGAVLVLLLLARRALGLNLVLAGWDGVVELVLDVERKLACRNVDDVHHSLGGVRRTVFVGHGDGDLDLGARFRVRWCGCGDLAIVVDGRGPAIRNGAQLVRVFLSHFDVVRILEVNRQRCRTTRVNRFLRVGRIGFPVVGEVHHGGHGDLRG